MAAGGPLVPLLAGVVSAGFAYLVWRQYAERKRAHQLAWGLGLSAYAIASVVEAAALAQGWDAPLYRAFFATAGANVGLLGLGTLLLSAPARVGRALMGLAAILVAVAALAQFAVPLDASTPVTIEGETRPLAEWGSDVGAKPVPFPQPARLAFLALNVAGGLALIVGALWSWWRTRRAGVLLIGVGAMLPFLGGSLSTLSGLDWRVLLQFLGIAVMFAGYLQGREAKPPTPAREAAEA